MMMYKFNRSTLYFLIAISFLFTGLSGCSLIKPAAERSGSKYFETFYVGEDGSQYFIKPLYFKSSKTEEILLVDFTFRYKNIIKDSAIVNFSVKGPTLYKSLDNLEISTQQTTVKGSSISLLYNEKIKVGFLSRFSTKMSVADIKTLFSNKNWKVSFKGKGLSSEFTPSKSSINAIEVLNNKVFVLM